MRNSNKLLLFFNLCEHHLVKNRNKTTLHTLWLWSLQNGHSMFVCNSVKIAIFFAPPYPKMKPRKYMPKNKSYIYLLIILTLPC